MGGNCGFRRRLRSGRELHMWEGITKWGETPSGRKSLRVGKCMSGRKLRSRRKCRSGSDFQVRGNYKVRRNYSFAGNLQKCAKRRKVPGQLLVNLSICGTIDSRPSIESRRDLAGREPGRTHGGSGPRGRPSGVPRPLSRPKCLYRCPGPWRAPTATLCAERNAHP